MSLASHHRKMHVACQKGCAGNPIDRPCLQAAAAQKIAIAYISGIGLDTYEGEPKLNPGSTSLKNTFLLPHLGAATIETRTAMGMLALDNIDAVLRRKIRPISRELDSECSSLSLRRKSEYRT
jgi:hypothetical protein